jgi:hypothetical protein
MAVVWGLGFSTLITLVLTPTLLAAQPRQARFFYLLGWPARWVWRTIKAVFGGRRPQAQPAE